ncbi:MAG: hypothetical protein Q7T61_20190 [Caulobacter sp.]|nr:hypothetical protein [Caulobacter sp.]
MLHQRRAAADAVSKQLFEAEDALDIALAAVAGLAMTMPTARKEANLSVLYAQEAFEGATETLAHLTRARRTIIDTHKALAVAQEQLGLKRYMGGPGNDKPQTTPPTGVYLQEVIAA